MAKIDFIKGLKTVADSIPLIGTIVFGLTVLGLAVGVLLGIATDGSISMYSRITTFLNGTWATDVVSFFTTMSTSVKTVLGLLVLVVIIALFGIKLSQGKSSKGSNV